MHCILANGEETSDLGDFNEACLMLGKEGKAKLWISLYILRPGDEYIIENHFQRENIVVVELETTPHFCPQLLMQKGKCIAFD